MSPVEIVIVVVASSVALYAGLREIASAIRYAARDKPDSDPLATPHPGKIAP